MTWARLRRSLLLHEWVWAAFLLVTWGRLIVAAGWVARDTLVFLALLLTAMALVAWCERAPGLGRWRWRLAFYPAAMNVVYPVLKTAGPTMRPELYDAPLQAVDRLLVGGDPGLWWERWVNPALTEVLSGCYLLFFPYLFLSWIYYFFRRELPEVKQMFAGFFFIYGLGFVGYSFVPAVGPHLDPGMAARYSVPLTGGVLTQLNAEIVRRGSNHVDAFLSLHCAISSYLLAFDWRHARWRFWVYLVPCVGLWVSTLYLRYHYFTDLLAGFALSATALWLVHHQPRKSHEPPPSL